MTKPSCQSIVSSMHHILSVWISCFHKIVERNLQIITQSFETSIRFAIVQFVCRFKAKMSLRIHLILVLMSFVNSQDTGIDFILPNTTKPVSYDLLISTNVPAAAVAFSGISKTTLRVLEDTNEIFLHSRQHRITTFKLYEIVGTVGVKLNGVNYTRENANVIKFTSIETLKSGSLYELLLEFQGSLLRSADGFFRSDYVENVNGSDVYT